MTTHWRPLVWWTLQMPNPHLRFRSIGQRAMRAVALASLLAWLGGVSPVQASPFQLAIDTGGLPIRIVDNTGVDTNLAVGTIAGTVGISGYNVSFLAQVLQTATSGVITSQANVMDTLLNVPPANIRIITSFNEFTFASAGTSVTAFSSLSVIQLLAGDSVSFVSALDGTTSALLILTGPVPVGPAATVLTDLIGSSPFLMSNTITIGGLSTPLQGPAATARVTGTTQAGTQVPEPGSLLQLGGGLFASAIARRRRRRAANDLENPM